MRTESYGAFAYAYDRALGERFFRAAKRMLTGVLGRYDTPADKTHLDLACGTGLAMRFFTANGYRSTGVDASIPMLAVARDRVQRLAAADFRALPFRGSFARVTCLFDSLNHMKTIDDLAAAFRAVRGVMNAESLFLFDMNHPDIYPEVWGTKEPFVATGEGYHLEIATAFRKRDATGLALVTGWARLPSGTVFPISERHEQRAYSEREIFDALAAAGLTPAEVSDFDPYNESDTLEARTVKLFFVCRAR
ncbi:MAG TPA: class I SAM-dependent methyltransferase [Thermoanaerobaculia bacterium]|nr:class I SAM-dependent methyltransferase [Thermoanaerobaculia bacterium]